MNGLWKKAAVRSSIGFVMGVLVGMGFLSTTGFSEYLAQYGPGRFILYMFSSGMLGAINMGATIIYEMEHWGLLRCTLSHFAIAMATYFTIGFSMGWLRLRDPFTGLMSAACVVIYFIIWLIIWLLNRRRIRKVNEALKAWKDEQKNPKQKTAG